MKKKKTETVPTFRGDAWELRNGDCIEQLATVADNTIDLSVYSPLGRPLPATAQVHHVGGGRREDSPLVICEDAAYHKFLHARARVLEAGGNPNTEIICKTCKALTSNTGRLGGKVERCAPCNRAHSRGVRQHTF